ncbi:MAG TPA: signal peptide peptidase SppA, partial [Kofleriaceae bacterium]|nr:signal peptide peptidase SppA [Kofleriaceae bacterium]
EVVGRPTGTDRLELALGGRIGEVRGDADGWLRVASRVARGVSVTAMAESRALSALDTSPSGTMDVDGRELRLAAGLEVSFGRWGGAFYGSGRVDERGDGHAVGGTLVARWASRPEPPVQGHAGRIERLDLTGSISSRALTDLVLRLRDVARDPAVRAVVVSIDGVTSGWATVDELRRELEAVRAHGKPVFAYIVAASTRDYWLATAATKIYLDPAGGVRLTGLAATQLYFKGALDRIGANAEIEKIGEWKSAPEAYTATGPSEAAQQMHEEIYDSWWETFVDGLAHGRRIDPAQVPALLDAGPYSAGQLEHEPRLVDEVATPDRIGALVAGELGGLAPVGRAPAEKDDRWSRPAIAVVYADGDIVDGSSRSLPVVGHKLVGSQSLSDALVAARVDPRIRAIVVRIDSPGGSALASEVISREVFATRGVKPIICSMGDVAASGGYFIAAGCDVIFADPMTVTGSIGIFTGKIDVSSLLAKAGITSKTTRRGVRADMDSIFRPYTDDERAVVLDRLQYFYHRFTQTVSAGRGLPEERVDAVGRGHVWTGAQALPLGLVDRLGGIGDAIALAEQRAGLPAGGRVRIVSLPRVRTGLLGVLGSLAGVSASADGATDAAGLASIPLLRQVLAALPASLLAEPDAVQARLPFDLVWE